jgi:hypothetical protein
MANPSKRDSNAKKVVTAARTLVTYELGIPRACQRISRALIWLSPYEHDLPTIFNEYLKKTAALPIGPERLQWSRDVLKEKDIQLEGINRKYRDALFDAAWGLIDRFDPK